MKRLLVLPFLLLFAGCGMTATTHQRAPRPVAASTRPIAASSARRPVPDRVIASRVSHPGIYPVRLQIIQLERAGTTTTLGLRLKSRATLGPYVSNWFDDGATQPVRNSDSREHGCGEASPVASNATAHGRSLNRRVEIRFR